MIKRTSAKKTKQEREKQDKIVRKIYAEDDVGKRSKLLKENLHQITFDECLLKLTPAFHSMSIDRKIIVDKLNNNPAPTTPAA